MTSGLVNHYKKNNKMNSLTFVCGDLPAEIFTHARNIDRLITLKKKKNSSHWLLLWIKVFLNFWDEIVDLRGSAISYFLFTKKRIINPYIVKDKK